MEDFYARLKQYKDSNRLRNKDLGEIISMEGEAFRMAVVRKSLSDLEKEKLSNLFEEANKPNTPEAVSKDETGVLNDDNVTDYIIEHADRLRKTNSKFRMFCEFLEVKAEREIMRKLQEQA